MCIACAMLREESVPFVRAKDSQRCHWVGGPDRLNSRLSFLRRQSARSVVFESTKIINVIESETHKERFPVRKRRKLLKIYGMLLKISITLALAANDAHLKVPCIPFLKIIAISRRGPYDFPP